MESLRHLFIAAVLVVSVGQKAIGQNATKVVDHGADGEKLTINSLDGFRSMALQYLSLIDAIVS
jgi:hypothetical protein